MGVGFNSNLVRADGRRAIFPGRDMQTSASPSLVRADQRFSCSLSAVLRPVSDAEESVSLARAVGEGDGTVKITVVDASRGGIGVTAPIFLPRGSHVEVRIFGPRGELGVVTTRVQRVEMRDRHPTYYLGLAALSVGDAAPVMQAVLAEVRR